ncbi:hypothetical protein D3C78_627880 [compost metagenome]
MLIRAFEPSDFPQDSSISWDQAYISYATNLGWTLSPYNPPLTRGGAAQLLANASGKSYSINDSVQYLLDVNLTNGKTTKTLNGFAKQDPLTRIEAIAFIKKFKQNYNKLSLSPSVVQPYNREENVIVFNNEAFKFTLTLPLSWNNKYKVIDSSDAKKPGFYNFDFVFQPSSSSGILFTLSVWPKEYWKISGTNMIENVPVVKKLGEYNGNVYIFHIPTDVQYDPNSETEVQTYNSLFEDVKTIPFTFELVQ